jgi:ubiquinone/menaquinone biosynthesis C-methylase UbiE
VRCGLSDRVTFQAGDAADLPFEDAAFGTVFLQHVATNIEDRAALYAEGHRVCGVLTASKVEWPGALGAIRIESIA